MQKNRNEILSRWAARPVWVKVFCVSFVLILGVLFDFAPVWGFVCLGAFILVCAGIYQVHRQRRRWGKRG
jgi:hypothetical protein